MYFPTFSQLTQLFAPSLALSHSVISQHTDKHAGSSLLRYYLVLFFSKTIVLHSQIDRFGSYQFSKIAQLSFASRRLSPSLSPDEQH